MKILAEQQHRPWPVPAAPWLMTQTWEDLLFAHWPVPAGQVAPKLPAGLRLDLHQGRAWVGVVPFRMSGVRLRGVVGLPTATRFAELNLRTYVVRDGKPGVFFFSLDAESRLAVAGARRFFHLPYCYARMAVRPQGGWIDYESRRLGSGGLGSAGPGAEFRGRYRPDGAVRLAEPGTLEHWLTERYCLYAAGPGRDIYRGEIHHGPWPLQPAVAEIQANTIAAAAGIALPDSPPLLHFARRLDVLVWPLVQA